MLPVMMGTLSYCMLLLVSRGIFKHPPEGLFKILLWVLACLKAIRKAWSLDRHAKTLQLTYIVSCLWSFLLDQLSVMNFWFRNLLEHEP